MNEKISNKTLAIALCPIYLFITLFILFIIGLSKVDAKSYFAIYNKDNVNQSIVNNYPLGGTFSYVGKIDYPAFNVINDSFNFVEGNVYRLRVNISISYYVPLSFNNYCESFGRSAVLQDYNRNGSTFSTLTRLWTMNNCSIVSYGNGWKYEFSYSYDATFVATSNLAKYNRISWSTALNSPTSGPANYKVEYTLTGFNVFNLGASDDKKTQDMINSINNAIQSQIDNDNKNTQAIIDKITESNKTQQETNDKIDEIDDYLKDETEPESDISSLGNVSGLLPPGPLDTLLNIPFNFLSVVVSSLGGVCVPLSGKFVFDSTLTLPCFSDQIYDEVPAGLMVFINLIPTAFLLIKYLKHLYKKVERATSLETTTDDEWGCI